MRIFRNAAAAIALSLICALRLSTAAEEAGESLEMAQSLGRAYARAAGVISPSVVHIASSRAGNGLGGGFLGRFFDIPRDMLALGSGVIVRSDGYIVTNYHVVQAAEKLSVKLRDGRVFVAQVIGTDPPTDLAMIKVDAEGLPAAELGDSDEMTVGSIVLAVGNPYGLDDTVTQGIISATGRANVGIADYEDFLQTDAAINPGNSGGPLIDITGRVVGINTAIFSRTGGFQGISLAIPSNIVRRVAESLIEKGTVARGYLGVTIQNITPERAKSLEIEPGGGVEITEVVQGAPADAAGLKKGDIITEFERRKVTDVRSFRSMVATTRIDEEVRLTVLRNGDTETITVKIGQMQPREVTQPAPASGKRIARLGIDVSDLDDQLRERFEIKARKGVLVVGVVPGSPADVAGIRPGQAILEINHKQSPTVARFESLLDSIPEKTNLLLMMQDSALTFYTVVRPEG